MRLGWPEIVLILAVVLIVFGAGKLPQIGAQLGKGLREFRKATRSEPDETEQTATENKSKVDDQSSR
jgi:sec-independent protein translocase protein TatA